MSKRSFLRKSAVSLAATLGLGGSTLVAQINVPPNVTGTVGGGTITFPSGPIGAQAVNLNGGILTLDLNAAGQRGFSALDGRFYDTAGGPPTGAFDTVAGIEALAAEAGSLLVADIPLTTPVDFPTTPAGTMPPFLSSTDGQPFLSTGVTMTGTTGDPDESWFAIFEGKLNVITSQQHHFYTSSDDGSVMFVDVNRDNDFTDAGERVVFNNLYQGTQKRGSGVPGDPALVQEPAPVLAPGTYNVYIASYEGGGGKSIHASWAFGDFAADEEIIPLITATATVTNSVNVTADATINMASGGLNVSLGPLTISNNATLTKAGGAPLTFSQTTVGATSGINVGAGNLTTGAVTSAGAITTFTKSGAGTLLLTDNSKASGFAAASNLNITGGRLVALSRSGPDRATVIPSTIGDAKISLSNGGTFVGRQISYDGAVPSPGRVAVTFFSGASSEAQIEPIDEGTGLLATASAGRTVNWNGSLGFDDDNPNFGLPNFNAISDNFVGVDNLQVLGYGKATFTNDATTGSKYSFGAWSDDGVTFWVDLDNDNKFESPDNGSGKNELVMDDNSFHAPRHFVQNDVDIPAGSYRVAAGFYEGGGNAVMDFRIARGNVTAGGYDDLKSKFRPIGPSDTTIISKFESLNPTAGGPMFGVNADFSKNPVTVAGTGGLSGEGLVQYGDVTLQNNSELKVSGSIKIANTIVDGTAKMFFSNDVDFGKLQPATAGGNFTFIKTGPADVNLAFAQTSTLDSKATIGVGQGRLLGNGATATAPSSLGGARLLMAGGTFAPQGGGFAPPTFSAPGAAGTLTEYFYNFNVNPPEAIIDPISSQAGLLGRSPSQTLSLNTPLENINDAYAQTRWGDQESLALMWLGDMTFTTDPTAGNVYSFWSNTDDGSMWWIDLDDNGKFEQVNGAGQNEGILDNNVYQGPTARRGRARVGGSATTTVTPGTHLVALGAYEGGGGMLFDFKFGRGDIADYADAQLQFVNPTVSSIASFRSRTYSSVDNFDVQSFTATPVDVTANSTIDNAGGSSKFGPVTFLNTATLSFATAGSQLASATSNSGTGTLQNNVGPNRLLVGDAGAAAGATLNFSGNNSRVTGSLTGAGTVKLSEGTLEFTRNGAAATGTPLLDIGGGTTMKFNPGAAGSFGGSAVTSVLNLGTLEATAGTTDLSGATINTPAIVAGLLGGRVSGGTNATDIPAVQGIDTRLSRAQTTDLNFFGGNGGTWVYRGEIKIPDTDGDGTPGPVAFAEQFDDWTLLKIDGKEYINNTAWDQPHSSGEIEVADTEPDGVGTAGDGWFTFESRHGDTGGGVGPNSGFTLGFGIDTNNADGFDAKTDVATNLPRATLAQYVEPVDNGSMNLFRVAPAPDMGQVRVLPGATLRIGSVVGANVVDIGAGSRLQLNGAGTSKIASSALTIAGTPAAPTGTLDVGNSAIALDYPAGGPNPAADVRSRIIAGRGAPGLLGTWDGKGITSSASAASADTTAVGYAVNADMPLGAVTTFRGQAVDPTTVLIRHTYIADANLDGVVNDDDVTIVGATYAPGVANASWANGDFDYNGFVDDDDVTLLGALYNPAAPPIPAPAGGVAAVPEPATWLMLTLGGLGAGLFGWRRRRQA